MLSLSELSRDVHSMACGREAFERAGRQAKADKVLHHGYQRYYPDFLSEYDIGSPILEICFGSGESLREALGNSLLGGCSEYERWLFVCDLPLRPSSNDFWAHVQSLWAGFDAESICSGTPTPCSDCLEQLPPGHEQIRQGCQHIDLAAVLG